jgi:inner membrane transporter RhtA
VIGAASRYLGPAFAVLLFARLAPLGVAWLRIATASVVFLIWRRPWRYLGRLTRGEWGTVLLLGTVLGLMNCAFYEAIARIPLGTVAAIEFLGPIGLAVVGMGSARNLAALGLAAAGTYALAQVRLTGAPMGYLFAFANCGLFVLYLVLGHRLAAAGSGVDRLALAMPVAMLVTLPLGFWETSAALASPPLLGAALAVGICSSVIPYVCDQLAMARLSRASFSLLLALLPATACLIGVLVLWQTPTPLELMGLVLVIGGVALHSDRERGLPMRVQATARASPRPRSSSPR